MCTGQEARGHKCKQSLQDVYVNLGLIFLRCHIIMDVSLSFNITFKTVMNKLLHCPFCISCSHCTVACSLHARHDNTYIGVNKVNMKDNHLEIFQNVYTFMPGNKSATFPLLIWEENKSYPSISFSHPVIFYPFICYSVYETTVFISGNGLNWNHLFILFYISSLNKFLLIEKILFLFQF